jgi:hypothetical protein
VFDALIHGHPLERHSQLLQHTKRYSVFGMRNRHDPLQTQFPEAVVQHRLGGLGGQSVAPVGVRQPVADFNVR